MSYLKSKVTLGIGVVLTSGIGAVTPALAQAPTSTASSAAKDNNDITEIIVTARRTEERLQDVPISITVYNEEQLANRNVTNAADLATFTPSLSANPNFGQENSSFAIRGFTQDAGTQPSVATYFADVVAPRGPTQGTQAGDGPGPGSFFDLQNIQVLKGPQGTLFGRNTTGGAILFVPQKPTAEFGGYAEVSYGNYDMKRIESAINLPISDTVRFRLAVDHENREGYLHNISGIGPSDYDDVDYTAVRGSLVVDLTANLENYTILSWTSSDTNGSVEKMIACNPTGYNPVNPATGLGNFIGVLSCNQLAHEKAVGAGFYDLEAAVPNPESRVLTSQAINTTTWTASDELTIKNIASYARYKDNQISPLFGTNWTTSGLPTPYPELFFNGVPRIFTGVFEAPGTSITDQDTFTEELQVQGSALDRRLIYQAGVYAEWSEPLALTGNESPQLAACTNVATLTCSDPVGQAFTAATSAELGFPYPVHVGAVNYTVGETNYRDQGLYTQSSFSITDQWKVTGGLRYTWDKAWNDATRISYSFPVFYPFTGTPTAACTEPATSPSCNGYLTEKSSKPTWLIGLDYKPTDDVLAYVKYSRGYRAGGVFTNGPVGDQTYQPEKVDTYEAGLKTSFNAAVRGTFDIDFFYNNFSNQQIQIGYNPATNPLTGATAPVSPTTGIENAGKSKIYGSEIEASLQPFPSITALAGLNLGVSYTYLFTKIESIQPVTSEDPNYVVAPTALAPGEPLVLSPKNKVDLTVNYTLPLPVDVGRITLGTSFVHTDKQLSTYEDSSPAIVALFGSDLGVLPPTNLLNLSLNWNSVMHSMFDVSAFATNVTAHEYYSYVPGLTGSGAEFAVPGEPRMYGVRLKYRFGN
jgi:iron complex outermembrane receptor protein